MADLTKIAEDLSSLTVMEAADLSKILEEKWGVSAAAPVAAVAAAASNDGEAEAEKTEFDLILTGFGEKKVGVIKAVRAITGLGLKEAKALVEGAPASVKTAMAKADAEKAKSELEAAGATAEIK